MSISHRMNACSFLYTTLDTRQRSNSESSCSLFLFLIKKIGVQLCSAVIKVMRYILLIVFLLENFNYIDNDRRGKKPELLVQSIMEKTIKDILARELVKKTFIVSRFIITISMQYIFYIEIVHIMFFFGRNSNFGKTEK